ncbi:glutamic acid-rich protein-like [Tribolium madens]|uniref:glutamic acid-rich protein-like n=1 Tax=Tribolium madens TaxID=41895 RepID=UPI001CF75812|nr:glutamic acid-rich protein-like [Tribolium madens]
MKKHSHSEISESAESSEADDATSTIANIQTKSSSPSPSVSESEEAQTSPTPAKSREKVSTSPKKKSSSSPLKDFIAQHPEYEKITLDDVVSEDDDICILEVPNTIDSDCFIGKLINFEKKTKLKLGGQKYVIEPTFEDIKPINLVSRNIKMIRPVANLKLREYHKEKREDKFVNVDKCKLALPEKIKVRHPLFGVEYKQKITLSEEVQRKLDNTIEKALKKMKKKKHKDETLNSEKVKKDKNQIKQESITSVEEQNESFFEALSSHIGEKKKKKHESREKKIKHELVSEVDEPLESPTEEKKKKRHKVFTDYQEDKNEVDETIESPVEEKKKKTHKVFTDHQEDKNEKKKKRKSSINEGVSATNEFALNFDFMNEIGGSSKMINNGQKQKFNTSVKTEKDDSVHEKSRKHSSTSHDESFFGNNSLQEKKLEKKHNNLINSTVVPGLHLPLFDFDVSGITSKEDHEIEREQSPANSQSREENEQSVKKKKKKIKLEKEETDEALGKKRRDSVESEATSPKKKIKKIKQEKEEEEVATNSLIFDILNKVKSEIDSPAKHKKKKKSDG